jgi:hypothetical protein
MSSSRTINGKPAKNKELQVSVQFGALIVLWAIWFLVVVLVVWKEWTMQPLEMYGNPALICSVLFAVFPLVLAALGGFFLLHAPFAENLIHRAFRCFVAALTFFGLVVFSIGCVLSTILISVQQARE